MIHFKLLEEAFIGSAILYNVHVVDDDGADTESLTDLILNNMSEEDLEEHFRDENTLNMAVADIAEQGSFKSKLYIDIYDSIFQK